MKKTHLKKCEGILLNFIILILFNATTANAEDGDLVEAPISVECRSSVKDRVEAYQIKYESDGLHIPGFLIVPVATDKDRGPFPCVIYNRGGNNYEEDYGALTIDGPVCGHLARLASKGYVVIASQYRGVGPDADWPKAADRDQFGGKDVNDVINLIPLLQKLQKGSHPDSVKLPKGMSKKVNSDKIAMYGWSRGGMMTYLALRQLAAQSDKLPITTAVVGAGLADLFTSELNRPGLRPSVHQALIPDYDESRTAKLKERSAVFWADELPKSVSLLLLHGTSDTEVNISQARELADRLHFFGHPHQIFFVEQFDHGFFRRPMDQPLDRDSPMHISWDDVIVTEWLNRHLK